MSRADVQSGARTWTSSASRAKSACRPARVRIDPEPCDRPPGARSGCNWSGPYHIKKFQQKTDAAAKLVTFNKISSSWDRRSLIDKGGWATMPGTGYSELGGSWRLRRTAWQLDLGTWPPIRLLRGSTTGANGVARWARMRALGFRDVQLGVEDLPGAVDLSICGRSPWTTPSVAHNSTGRQTRKMVYTEPRKEERPPSFESTLRAPLGPAAHVKIAVTQSFVVRLTPFSKT